MMKLKCSFEMVNIDDEIIAVPCGKGADKITGVLKMNKEGGEILGLLQNDISEEEIIEKIVSKYDNDIETISKYVRSFVYKLKKDNLIE